MSKEMFSSDSLVKLHILSDNRIEKNAHVVITVFFYLVLNIYTHHKSLFIIIQIRTYSFEAKIKEIYR